MTIVSMRFKPLSARALAGLMVQVWQRAQLRPPGLGASALLLVVYLAAAVSAGWVLWLGWVGSAG